MTREQTHALLTNPQTSKLLDRLVEATRRGDAEDDARRRREENEAIYLRYVRSNWLVKP